MSSLELLFVYKVCNALQLTPPSVERLYTCHTSSVSENATSNQEHAGAAGTYQISPRIVRAAEHSRFAERYEGASAGAE